MKIAHINTENKLLGWYDSSIHKNIPTPNIQVTKEQWKDSITNNCNKINKDGTPEIFDFRIDADIKSSLVNEINTKIKTHFGNLIDEGFQYKEYWITSKQKQQDDLHKRISGVEMLGLEVGKYKCYKYINNKKSDNKEIFPFSLEELKNIYKVGSVFIDKTLQEEEDMLISIRKLSITKLQNFKI